MNLRYPLTLHKEDILPRLHTTRPGVNRLEIQPMSLENRKRIRQRARRIVLHHEGYKTLPTAMLRTIPIPRTPRNTLPRLLSLRIPQYQKPRRILLTVLDIPGRHDQTVVFARKLARDGGGVVSGFLGYEFSGFGGGGYILSFDTSEVFREEGLALAPGLRVGVEFCYVGVGVGGLVLWDY